MWPHGWPRRGDRESLKELKRGVYPEEVAAPFDTSILDVYREHTKDVPPAEFIWLSRGQQRPRGCIARRSIFGTPVVVESGRALQLWRAFMLLVDLTYTALFLPASLALTDRFHSNVSWRADMVAGAFFTADFFVALHVPWTITCCHQWAKIDNGAGISYLYRTKGTFFIDLMAVIPFVMQCFIDIIVTNQVLWLVHAIFVMRLLRLARLVSIVKALARGQLTPQASSRFMSASGWYLLSVLYCAAVMINLLASLWYLSAKAYGDEEHSWLARVGDRDLTNAPVMTRYLAALYFTCTTLTTVGFGDIAATNDIEEVVAILIMCCGALFMSFIIGTVASLLSSRSVEGQRAQRFCSKVAYLDRWFAHSPVPAALERAVYLYYATQWARAADEREVWEQVAGGLPDGLRGQLVRATLGFSVPEGMRRLCAGLPKVVVNEVFALFQREVVPSHTIVCAWREQSVRSLCCLEYGRAMLLPVGLRVVTGPEGEGELQGSGAVMPLQTPCLFPWAAVEELSRITGLRLAGRDTGGEGVAQRNRGGEDGGQRQQQQQQQQQHEQEEQRKQEEQREQHRQDQQAGASSVNSREHNICWSSTMCIIWRVELHSLAMVCRRCPQLFHNLCSVMEAQEQLPQQEREQEQEQEEESQDQAHLENQQQDQRNQESP